MSNRRAFLTGCCWGAVLGCIGVLSAYGDLLRNGSSPRPWEGLLP